MQACCQHQLGTGITTDNMRQAPAMPAASAAKSIADLSYDVTCVCYIVKG